MLKNADQSFQPNASQLSDMGLTLPAASLNLCVNCSFQSPLPAGRITHVFSNNSQSVQQVPAWGLTTYPLPACWPHLCCVTQEAVEVTAVARHCSLASKRARILFSFLPNLCFGGFSLCFPCYWPLSLVHSILLVSGIEHSDYVIYKCAYIYIYSVETLSHYRLLQDIGYSFLCYTVGPCWFSILSIIMCLFYPQPPHLPLLPTFPLWLP